MPPFTADGAVWFGKNSDREPGEAQVVEHYPHKKYAGPARLRCTHVEIEQTSTTNEVLISRPFWMWGAEMGANEHHVAIGNEAVFTRLPYDKSGLTGMDLLRLALERAASAREALEVITILIARHGQGGGCGYRNRRFRYHNSFIIVDAEEAWVLETAGEHWAAERVRGIRTISNSLSIGRKFDLISAGAYRFAKSKGWCRSASDFDFARSFGDPFYSAMSGGAVRSACTTRLLAGSKGKLEIEDFFAALSDHAGRDPSSGWRMKMPCAHASWWPTRQAGQTTGSIVSRLHRSGSLHWLTGTSSPCLSVFKPVALDSERLSTGPAPDAGYDEESLFWRHERLHRIVLRDYERLRQSFNRRRLDLQNRIIAEAGAASFDGWWQKYWDEHRALIPEWLALVGRDAGQPSRASLFNRYWSNQDSLDSPTGSAPEGARTLSEQ